MRRTIRGSADPSRIMEVGMGFLASKTLLTAVNLGLFTCLSSGDRSGKEIQRVLGLHGRGLFDFLDALVALGFLKRTGIKETAIYSNADDADLFLDKNKKNYMGGILEMCNNRLYSFWNDLEEGLRTGLPQSETKQNEQSLFETVYASHEKLREFLSAMSGAQMGNFKTFAEKFDFSGYHSLCDIGGAGGDLCAQVSMQNDHLKCISFDLPPASAVAKENIRSLGLEDKIEVRSGDFFYDEFPRADILTMGNILHDWGSEDKKMLIKKAYDALPEAGVLVVLENIIDDDRRENAFGLLMSLNMLIETPEGFDFSRKDFDRWVRAAGFRKTEIMPLTGPSSAVIAIK